MTPSPKLPPAQARAVLRFHREVTTHSAEVRQRHAHVAMPELEHVSPDEQLVVLMEEVGKLSRATNKLRIATDEDTIRQWTEERQFRLLTIGSVIARIASNSY